MALLTAAELADIVQIHSQTPLTLTEIRPIFLTVPFSRDAFPALRASAAERTRKRILLSHLLTHMDNFNRAQPELVLAKAETLFGTILGERNGTLSGTAVDDIRQALALLQTVGAVSAVNGDGYVSDTTIEGALRLLTAFARRDDEETSADSATEPGPQRRA